MEEKDIEKRILEIVPQTGQSVGNKYLLTELKKNFKDLDVDIFWKVRNSLLENGKLGKGRGRGGSVYNLQGPTQPKVEIGKDLKKRITENELYEPWLYQFLIDN